LFPISVQRLKKPIFFVLVAAVALPAGSAPVIAHTPLWRLAPYSDTTIPNRNWAGYALIGAGYSDVQATWVQPAANCTSGETSESSFWVGLGGIIGGSVEQVGTEAACVKGTPTYFAWAELFPQPVQRLALNIQPGDQVSAEVSLKNGTYTLNISTQSGAADPVTSATTYVGDNLSAEWIAEAPSRCVGANFNCNVLPLTNFGSVNFTNATAKPGAGFQATLVMLTQSLQAEAVPTDFNGGSFTVNWLRK